MLERRRDLDLRGERSRRRRGPVREHGHRDGERRRPAALSSDSDAVALLRRRARDRRSRSRSTGTTPTPLRGHRWTGRRSVDWNYAIDEHGQRAAPSGPWPTTRTRADRLPAPGDPGAGQVRHVSRVAGGRRTSGRTPNTATATGTVRGTGTPGVTTSDTDPANYFGVAGGDRRREGHERRRRRPAARPRDRGGRSRSLGPTSSRTRGNGPLTNIVVTDDRGVSVTCPQTALAAGDSMACTGAGIATADKYTNTATATGRTLTGERVSDEDPSNYFGTTPGVLIEKSTNGVDADDAPGVLIPVGQPVEWTYTVTNTGNNTLNDIDVSDDQSVTVTCPSTTLDVGEQMTCTASGTAAEGDYENTGTVTAVGSAGTPVTDDDPSHYYGVVSEIHVEKFTNGVDADTPTGPNIPVGAPVTWTYQGHQPRQRADHQRRPRRRQGRDAELRVGRRQQRRRTAARRDLGLRGARDGHRRAVRERGHGHRTRPTRGPAHRQRPLALHLRSDPAAAAATVDRGAARHRDRRPAAATTRAAQTGRQRARARRPARELPTPGPQHRAVARRTVSASATASRVVSSSPPPAARRSRAAAPASPSARSAPAARARSWSAPAPRAPSAPTASATPPSAPHEGSGCAPCAPASTCCPPSPAAAAASPADPHADVTRPLLDLAEPDARLPGRHRQRLVRRSRVAT